MQGGRTARTPRVIVSASPLWKIRAARELPRYLVYGLSIAGLAASARYAIAPPRPQAPARALPPSHTQDLAAEGFAQLFVRAYLTWRAGDPEAHVEALSAFVGSALEPGAGFQPPASGEEQVQWTEIAQERAGTPGEHVYTVAAQTDTAGLVYLSVSVIRARDDELELAGYPAFVGAPASGPASVATRPREVDDPALETVVERALRNYLAASSGELAADLAAGARVSLPSQAMNMESLQRLDWSAEGGQALTAIVVARDARGARYTLAYALDVSRVASRWEVVAIQMDPYT